MCVCHVGGDSMSLQLSGRAAGDDEKLQDSSRDGPPQLLVDCNKLELSTPTGTVATGKSSIRNKYNKSVIIKFNNKHIVNN